MSPRKHSRLRKSCHREKRNVEIPNHPCTTFMLERVFWEILDDEWDKTDLPLGEFLFEKIKQFPSTSRASSLRVAAMTYLEQSKAG